MPSQTFTAVLHKEEHLHVAECPEVVTARQSATLRRQSPIFAKRRRCIWSNFPARLVNV